MKDALKSDTGPLPMNHELFQFVRNDLSASTINALPLTNDFKRWFERLEFIEKQVAELCVGRMVYSETREMYSRNPEIQKPSIFYSWMQGLFVSWAVTMVASLVDNRKDTWSFVRLLRDIEKSSNPPSREHLVTLYTIGMKNFPKEEAASIASREFDELVGSSENLLPKKKVLTDIDELQKVAGPVVRLRHDFVAHLSGKPSEQLPSYENLDAAICKIVALLDKYSLLIRGFRADPNPTFQYDWMAIFRVPWIAA
jgi:hypothetical protein